jgi:hypothetical protein
VTRLTFETLSLQGKLAFGELLPTLWRGAKQSHPNLFSARCSSSGSMRQVNPGTPIFFSFYGNEFYYTNALILLVRRICVVIFIRALAVNVIQKRVGELTFL